VVPMVKLGGVLLGDGDALVEKATSQTVRREPIPATRGAITDRNGVELAISVPRVLVAVNNQRLTELAADDPGVPDRFARTLADALDLPVSGLAARLRGAGGDDVWVKLVDEVTPAAAERARLALLEERLLDPLVYENHSVRFHPSGDSGLRLLGTTGPDGPGPSAGIERLFDAELTGVDGRRVMEVAPGGNLIAGTERVVEEPVPGATVRLTIDRSLQFEAERLLLRGARAAGARGGVAIVGRPGTGELLAVAAVDTDPDTGELRLAPGPKAFSDAYQAGSVFKVVPVAAAIAEGVVDARTTFSVPDRIVVADREFTDHDPHPTEQMTVEQILSRSSNVGTIQIAQLLGAERLHRALVDFGFGARTGVSHPAESPGILPALDRWTTPDLAASSIGTHQSATAVQLWAAYNTVANGGTWVPPRLVDQLEHPDGTTTDPVTTSSRRVLSPEVAASVEAALRAVVTDGTGRQWDLPGFPVAAKTGTGRIPAPEVVDPEDAYIWSDGRYHHVNAFAGYLPVGDPQVSITVLLEDVAAGLTGSTGAGPVFADLARMGIRELGIAPVVADQATRAAAAGSPVRAAAAPSPGSPEGGRGDG